LNAVRIVGGEFRRRILRFPDSSGLRPTPDRVRETLFNWLGQDLDGWHCLDLFAGSGALGFEAASRGAARVVMVEQAPKVLAALHENHELLHKPAAVEIIRSDALQYLSSTQSTFDLIFSITLQQRLDCPPGTTPSRRSERRRSALRRSGAHNRIAWRMAHRAPGQGGGSSLSLVAAATT
jgi:AcrR family transcriptional regulator